MPANTQCSECLLEGDDDEFLTPDHIIPDRAIKKELYREPAQCPNSGCPWTGRYRDYIPPGHHQVCDYVTVTCECGVEVSRDEYESHQKHLCKLRMCIYGCQAPYTDQHQRECVVPHINSILEKVTGLQRRISPPETPELTTLMNRMTIVEGTVADLRGQLDRRTLPPTGSPRADGNRIPMARNTASPSTFARDEATRDNAETPDIAQAACGHAISVYIPARSYPNTTTTTTTSSTTTHNVPHSHPRPNTPITDVKDRIDNAEALAAALNNEIGDVITSHNDVSQETAVTAETITVLRDRVTALERQHALKDVALAEKGKLLDSLEHTSFTGTMVWAVTDFSRKRQEAIEGRTPSIYSCVFYTSRAGYKVCARLYLNGDGMGRGTHISLFFVIMRGQYDAILPWPFKQKVTLMLLDQNKSEHVVEAFRPDPTSSSFKRPQSDMNIASGVPLFCPLSKLGENNSPYVQNNTMFIKITIVTDGL